MTDMTTAVKVEFLADKIADIDDGQLVTDLRHAELAALVSKLTVAVEALERKVESLVRLELEDAGLIKPGIDPPDIGNLPDVGNTWNDSTDGAEFNQGEGVT